METQPASPPRGVPDRGSCVAPAARLLWHLLTGQIAIEGSGSGLFLQDPGRRRIREDSGSGDIADSDNRNPLRRDVSVVRRGARTYERPAPTTANNRPTCRIDSASMRWSIR